MGATNLIAGTHSASIWVRIPRRVQVPAVGLSNPSVTYSGEGRFFGFVLASAQDAGNAGSAGPYGMEGGSLGGCDSYGCTQRDPATYVQPLGASFPNGANAWTLPSGLYKLFLIADGRSQITVRLPGLTGLAAISPHTPIAVAVSAPSPTLQVPLPGPPIYGATTSHATTTWTLGFVGARFEVSGPSTYNAFACFSHGPPGPSDYLIPLGCPGASAIDRQSGANLSLTGQGGGFLAWVEEDVAGPWRSGIGYVYAGQSIRAHLVTWWLDMDRSDRPLEAEIIGPEKSSATAGSADRSHLPSTTAPPPSTQVDGGPGLVLLAVCLSSSAALGSLPRRGPARTARPRSTSI